MAGVVLQDEEPLDVWRAVQAALLGRPTPCPDDLLDDVLDAMRHTVSVPTTVRRDGEPNQDERRALLLLRLWWWLFASEGDNACLAFLDDDAAAGDADCDYRKEKQGREEVFLALAPAVLDRLVQESWSIQTLICSSSEEVPLMIWRRLEQACRRDGTTTPRQTKQQQDTPWGDDTPAELVRVLLRCIKAGACRPPQELIASILCHSDGSIVLGTHTCVDMHTCCSSI
jgi:hypothetical protein